MRLVRSFVVFMAGSVGQMQPCGPLREAAGGATKGEIRRKDTEQPLLIAIEKRI